MDRDGDGIHVYGTPDPDNPGPPAGGGMRGERTGDQNRIDRDDSAEETPGGLDPVLPSDPLDVNSPYPAAPKQLRDTSCLGGYDGSVRE